MARDLAPLFSPRAIAVFGASADPRRLGSTVLRNLLASSFKGHVYPVGRSGGEVQGLTCLTSAEALPEGVDLAYLAIPAESIVETVRQCADRGVRAVIVGASGFAESGEEGKARQAALAQVVRETGVMV
ncbi:MAG: CoA-binding protein, partial [Phenylobacterium sp.]